MATTLGTAYLHLAASAEGLENSISSVLNKEATSAGNSAGTTIASGIKTALGTSGKVIGAGLAVATTAVTTMTAGIVSGTKATAQYGDAIDKTSQKLGVSSKFYQEWDAVLQHSGTSMSAQTATFKTLAKAAQDGSKDQVAAFEAIGLSMEKVQSMSTEQLFAEVISGLQGMEEGTERTALATQLLGRGSMEMGALLNTSAEDTKKMIDTVNDLGGVMSDKAVKDAAAFQDALQDMSTSFGGLKNKMMGEFLPSVTTVMNGLAKVASGDDSGLGMISEGVNQFVSDLSAMVPRLMEVGGQMIVTLGNALIENLPILVTALVDLFASLAEALPLMTATFSELVPQIVQTLLDALPMLLDVGFQIISELAMGISQSLPELIPSVVGIILQMVDVLIENHEMMVEASVALMLGLTEGIVSATPMLIEKMPEIIVQMCAAIVKSLPLILAQGVAIVVMLAQGIVTSMGKAFVAMSDLLTQVLTKIRGFLPNWMQSGVDIALGILQGIKNGWSSVINWITDACSKLVDKVKSFFGIASPSKLFRDQVGVFLAEGIGVGFTEEMEDVNNSIGDAIQTDFDVQSQISASSSRSMQSGVKTDTNVDFSTILNAIENLGIAIQNQSIVMDSGALVGSIAPAMDNELGRLSSRSLRGAY